MNKIEIIKKDDNARNMKQQSKSTFNVIHKSYTFYDTYTLKQNEVLMNRPLYLGLTILELGKDFGMKHVMINYNLMLDRQKYNYLLWTAVVLYLVLELKIY